MPVLYLRNVPEEVKDKLEKLAAAAGISMSALVVRELEDLTRRADNPLLLQRLPSIGVSAKEIVKELEGSRNQR